MISRARYFLSRPDHTTPHHTVQYHTIPYFKLSKWGDVLRK